MGRGGGCAHPFYMMIFVREFSSGWGLLMRTHVRSPLRDGRTARCPHEPDFTFSCTD